MKSPVCSRSSYLAIVPLIFSLFCGTSGRAPHSDADRAGGTTLSRHQGTTGNPSHFFLSADVEHNLGREAWKTVRELLAPPITSLARADGTITGNTTEMQQLIHQQWCAQVFCRYASPHCQRPDPVASLRGHHAYIPQQSTHNMLFTTGPALHRSQEAVPLAAWTDGGRQNSTPYPHGCGATQHTCGMPWPRQPKNMRNNTVH